MPTAHKKETAIGYYAPRRKKHTDMNFCEKFTKIHGEKKLSALQNSLQSPKTELFNENSSKKEGDLMAT